MQASSMLPAGGTSNTQRKPVQKPSSTLCRNPEGRGDENPGRRYKCRSRKHRRLFLDANMRLDAIEHEAGGNAGEFVGLDFVQTAAVDATLSPQLCPRSFLPQRHRLRPKRF